MSTIQNDENIMTTADYDNDSGLNVGLTSLVDDQRCKGI